MIWERSCPPTEYVGSHLHYTHLFRTYWDWICFCLQPSPTCWPSMAASGGRIWVCIHQNTTSPNNHAETAQLWRNALLESCRNLGSKAQRMLCAASDYHPKRGHLCLQICPQFTAFRMCFFFFSFTTHSHIILLSTGSCIFPLQKFLGWKMKWTFLFPLFT